MKIISNFCFFFLNFFPIGNVRERCDSLPSRNRTISETSNQSIQMPPPRTVPPTANRPHSMYTHRHSHSPPVNSCTLSPSGGCSESDGSSLSIDETDGYGHSMTPEDGGFLRYISSMKKGTVIPEENCDDYWYENNKIKENGTSLNLPISQNQTNRKGSPAPPTSSSIERNYMEMYSPSGSSPGEQAGNAYMPMSPGIDFSRG